MAWTIVSAPMHSHPVSLSRELGSRGAFSPPGGPSLQPVIMSKWTSQLTLILLGQEGLAAAPVQTLEPSLASLAGLDRPSLQIQAPLNLQAHLQIIRQIPPSGTSTRPCHALSSSSAAPLKTLPELACSYSIDNFVVFALNVLHVGHLASGWKFDGLHNLLCPVYG